MSSISHSALGDDSLKYEHSDTYSGISVVSQVSDLPQADWCSVLKPDRLFMRPEFLGVCERSSSQEMGFRYAIKYINGEAVAVGYFQIVEFLGEDLRSYLPEEQSLKTPIYKINNKLLKFLDCTLNRINWKLLVSGNLFITGENGYAEQDDSNLTAIEVLHEMMGQIAERQESKDKIHAFMVSDLYAKDQRFINSPSCLKYTRVQVEEDMHIDLCADWKTFDDYLSSVSSKYRVRAKKVLKVSEEVKATEMSLGEIERASDEMNHLFTAVLENSDFNLARVSPNYFTEFKKAFPNRLSIVKYAIDHKLVGFIMYVDMGDTLFVHYVGIDYEANTKFRLYQRMLYDSMAWGINRTFQAIHFGRTAPEMKSTIGAEPEEMYCYIRHANFMSNLAIKPISSYFKTKEWTQRRPFKDR